MRVRILLLGLLAIAVSAAAPGVAHAVNTCNGLITIDYVAGPDFALPGDVVRVKLTLGTGSIQGGTKLNVNRLRFDLDCNSNFTLGIPCTDEGMIVEYEGDSTITSTCGVTWTTGHAVSDTPNEVVFTPSSPVMIPANQTIPPGFCALEFDVKVLARSTDGTPNEIEEVTGYLAAQNDARCDNNLTSTWQQSSSIPLCPDCNDNIECSQDMCDQSTGMCSHTPVADSTPCTDTDNNACTTAGCNGTLATGRSVTDGRDQNHMVKTTTDDTTPSTSPPTCNPQTGNCDFPNVPDSTPCPVIKKDPTSIKFGPPGAGLDQFMSHGRVTILGPVDVAGSEVGWLISGPRGRIYSVALPPETLKTGSSRRLFRYKNPAAESQG